MSHQLAREGLEVAECDTILGSNDEPELVAVLPPALGEGLGVGLVLQRRIGMASAPVGGAAVALQVAQMRRDGLALHTMVIEAWRRHYNEVRPHSSLGYLTLAEFVAKLEEQDAASRPATGRTAAVCGASALRPVASPSRKGQAKDQPRAEFSS